MKNRFSAFSIIVIFSCLTILGFFFIPQLSIKLNPSRKHPIVNIGFNMWGQSARVVESEVTSKLEGMLNRMPGVSNINSYSGNGYGRIAVFLSEYSDPDIARFEISTIVRQAWSSFPEGVSYPYIYMSGTSEETDRPFLRYTINAPYSPIEIRDYVNTMLRPKLSEIKGIEKVDVSGASQYIYKLEYDVFLLQNYNITISEIKNSINSYLTKEFLGIGAFQLEENDSHIRINLTLGGLNNDFHPSLIQIVNKEGKIIYLDQLVTSSYVEEESSSFFRVNGLNSIYLSITANDKSNSLALSKNTQQLLDDIKKYFPAGYELHLTYDEGEYIESELHKIYFRSGLTVFILLFFVFVVYRNFKYSFVIVASLIANISIAAIFYYLLNIEMHLFSLAGLTISLTLIIDNTIIMSDQIVQQGNRKVFMAIFTATITTIGSLSIIFLMDKNIQLNLYDFAFLIIINLTLSLITAITLVPALIEKLNLKKKVKARNTTRRQILLIHKLKIRPKRVLVYFNIIYKAVIVFCSKKKVRIVLVVTIILIFGLPVFMLPDKIGNQNNHYNNIYQKDDENKLISCYNNTLGSAFYKEHIKPTTDVIMGGTMRLFAQKVKTGSHRSSERSETTLNVTASLPNGSTRDQMDAIIRKMENYISQYSEVRQFETSIENGRRAGIRILFKKEYQRGQFPHMLYSKLISKATELGGGSWGVYGVGDGFNNELHEQAGSSRIKLLGYNYDKLNALASAMRDSLLQYRRIKEITIDSEFSWYKNDYMEFIFDLKKEKLAEANILPINLFNALTPMFQKNTQIATWVTDEKTTPVNLYSKQNEELDIWNLKNFSGKVDDREFKLSELANINKAQVPQNIAKENQQYRLCIQYEYQGSYQQAYNVMSRHIEQFNKSAPLGYKAESESYKYWWEKGNVSQYWLLFLIVAIMFLTTSVLFNSLKQPFIIIFIIPVSFIGIFLTFYLFEINFDQGGFAAFILLSGLSINANIYVLNEYNNIREANNGFSKMRAYLRAWNIKIRPIFLTIFSTILGFIPFMIGEFKEAFWFPLAVGTIGGLVVSFIALFLFLPLFMGIGNKQSFELIQKKHIGGS